MDIDEIGGLPINANGKIFRLGDIAKIYRDYTDVTDTKFFFNGEHAIEFS